MNTTNIKRISKHLLEVSKEAIFPSFSSASSFEDMVPVDAVRTILLMSPTTRPEQSQCRNDETSGNKCRNAHVPVLLVGEPRPFPPTTLSESLTVEPHDLWVM